MSYHFETIQLTAVYFLYPETRGVPLEEMDRLFGDEGAGDDDDDDDDYGASESSSLVASLRTSRSPSGLPTSRQPSPMPARADNSLLGRVTDAVGSAFGRPQRRRDSPSRGRYDAISDGTEQ